MTTISTDGDCATLINVFTVEPGRAAELADLLADATEKVMQLLPGFRSANIHISADGTRVTNYAQWADEQAFRDMQEDPAAREHMGRAAALAVSFDPHLYTVHSVHERST